MFKRSYLYVASIFASCITILAISWWFHHMDVTGSAFDVYPSRWINSAPFYSVVFIGSISGALFIASLIPWRNLRLASVVFFGAGVPILFLRTSYSWFGPYTWVDHPVSEEIIVMLSRIGVTTVVIGWLLSLVSAPIYLVVKLVKWARLSGMGRQQNEN